MDKPQVRVLSFNSIDGTIPSDIATGSTEPDDKKASEDGPPKSWFRRWFVEWWLMEIVSWFFGAICMSVIAIFLATLDGKPDPRQHMGISISAFISIFSGFTKSALLLPTAEALGQLKWDWFREQGEKDGKKNDFERLDSASRGSLGSLILLVRTRRVTLASIGAAIILLSLPLDGFFQRIATYPVATVPDPSVATVARAIVYDPAPQMFLRNTTQLVMSPDSQLDTFLWPFWTQDGFPPGVAYNCGTSNCTYEPFHTLAFDYQCKEMNASKWLDFGCKNTSAEWTTKIVYRDYDGIGADGIRNITSCGWYLPIPGHGPQLMSGYEVDPQDGSVGDMLSTRFFPIMDLATNELYWNGSINFPEAKNSVTNFILASTPGGFDGVLQNNEPILTECEIHWAVHTLKATVLAGNLTEEILERHEFESDVRNPWDPIDGSQWNVDYNMTLPDPQSPTNFSNFYVDNTTAFKVFGAWSEINPSTLLKPRGFDKPAFKLYWVNWVPNLWYVTNTQTPVLPWDAPSKDVEIHVGRAVNVMNQVIRRNMLSIRGLAGRDVAKGQAWKVIQIVRVDWAWLGMPLGLLVVSGGFLLATVVRNGRKGGKKTNGLGLLVGGMQERGGLRREGEGEGVLVKKAVVVVKELKGPEKVGG
ncbi:hypothetical protein BLS_001026 [Venturia inaequalis]|uniref:Uncharacterized protein n=1 Tax=Venturia inaequalis TaxID=5025 RepID=A0A8H3YXY6_VENIN|nr:hypothetical protein BLS_001026 [Venturia inaequalis]